MIVQARSWIRGSADYESAAPAATVTTVNLGKRAAKCVGGVLLARVFPLKAVRSPLPRLASSEPEHSLVSQLVVPGSFTA
jgi:hypothetical protein